MSMEAEIRGVETVTANMEKVTESILEELDRVVQREGLRIEGLAKQFSPIDTGRLRNSIHWQKLGEMHAQVSDGVFYGVFQEFGTSKMRPHPFFTPAIEVSISAFKAELAAVLDRIPKV